MSERVFIVGAGQVGRGLYKALRNSGIDVLGLHGRRPSAWTTSSGALPPAVANANAIIVAVRDNQIDDAVAELINERQQGSRGRIASGTVVVHTSGGAEPELIPRLTEFGMSGGTFHPLIPFANADRVPDLLKHAWIGIDGDDPARATSRRLAGHLGARTLDIPSGGKSMYHAAAVMSSNFPVVLAAIASDVLTSLGIPERSAENAVHGLMEAAVTNLADSSAAEALTGPVVRGETETVIRHLTALRSNADARAVYKRLSLAALSIAAERGVPRETIDEMQKVLLLR
ncbi:MAG TPA: DUF2520 domain-containing protein [Gemmatimonadaceae bacterium]|nr:DUF2520 domain-containing protein [Gemmatimonadaceae bacterium]